MPRLLNYRLIGRVISLNFLIAGIAFIPCMIVAIIYSESIYPFLDSSLVSISMGLVLYFLSFGVKHSKDIQKKEAYLAVTLSWVFLGLTGTLPYLFSHTIPGFINALFESVSGFTTTGSSILTDIESLPKSVLLWRSLTHWIGGIGIIMLVVLILPSSKIGGINLFSSESSLQDKIKPRIKQVGYRLLSIYVSLTVAEVVLLLFGRMSLYESVCNAFGTIATGGFSPKNDSITSYSPYIQYVIMVFMLLSGTSFIIHYLLMKRDFKKIKDNDEFRFYLFVTFVIGAVITAVLYFQTDKGLELSFRESFFQVISIITTTGFATSDYMLWPQFGWVLIFFAMFLGGSTGSTSGGIKMARHLILIKNIKHQLRQMIHPRAIIPIRFNNNNLDEETNTSAVSLIVLYFITFVVASVILLGTGLDGTTSTSAVATCMAGIGPGIGTVGPAGNFAYIPGIDKIILSAVMILGRLELYTAFVLFSKSFWMF